ncbi:MAG TPA: DUF4184 family protein [Steroidobacteraceae bacterium]|jgi:hypothetical protein
MPFTISHAAAALPVHAAWRRLPLAALMAGTMAPDYSYFVPVDPELIDSHSLPGLFFFCVPAGLLAWLYFVTLLERPTFAFLPDAWRTRLARTVLTPRALLAGALAVLVGAVTHIAWDFFTHSSKPLMQALPGMHDSYLDVFGPRIPVYFVLQVMSSAFGLGVLALWALNIRRKRAVAAEQCVPAFSPAVSGFERFLAVAFIAAAACAVGFLEALLRAEASRSHLVFVTLIGAMKGTAIAWSILAVAVRFRSRALRWLGQPDAR